LYTDNSSTAVNEETHLDTSEMKGLRKINRNDRRQR